jgi:CubicO group peptidase (beta-lactamase class C family)
MKIIPLLTIIVLTLFESCNKEDTVQTLDQKIEQIVKSHIVFGRTPGVAVGTYHNGIGKNYFFGTKNLSTGEPIDEFTIFEIGSVTKTFTALLFASYVIESNLNLTDTIDGYFPQNITVPSKDGVHIKFVNLLNHTSGLPYMPDNLPSDLSVADYSEVDLAAFFNGYELNSAPGTEYCYSNLGMGLAGYLVSNIFSTSYNQLLNEKIFSLMEMNYTSCDSASLLTSNFAQGYYGNQPVGFRQWSDIFAPAGAILSNLHDMMIYLKQNMEFENSSLSDALSLTKTSTFEINEHQHIGLGWNIIINDDNSNIYWHNGGTKGFSSFIAYNSSTQNGVVVLINSYCFGEQNIIGIEVLNLLDNN